MSYVRCSSRRYHLDRLHSCPVGLNCRAIRSEIVLLGLILIGCVPLFGQAISSPENELEKFVAEVAVRPLCRLGTEITTQPETAITPPDGVTFLGPNLLAATDAAYYRIQFFNPRTGEHLGHCGDPAIISGEIVNMTALPNGDLLTSDERAGQVYQLVKTGTGKPGYRLEEKPLFRQDGFKRLNGLAADSRGRVYVVDGARGIVNRYLPGFKPDPSWKFQSRRPDNSVLLSRTEGIAIDEKSGTLFLTDESDGVIYAFDLETGRWTGKAIGRRVDRETGKALGKSVFQESIEGLAVIDDYLLAVDAGRADNYGRLLIFDLRSPFLYDTGMEQCQQRMAAGNPSGLVGAMGHYHAPDGVAVFSGDDNAESLIAVAAQGDGQIMVYRWRDILAAMQR